METYTNKQNLFITGADDSDFVFVIPVVTDVRQFNKDIIQWFDESGRLCISDRSNPANVRAYNECIARFKAERTAYENALDKIARWAEGGPVQ